MAIMTLPYHVGIVVSDLREEMFRLSEILGVRWGEVSAVALRMDTPERVVDAECEFVYSIDGPPFLELIGHTPEGPWNSIGLHHLGFWGDSLEDSADLLLGNGCTRESVLVNEAGDWSGGLNVLTPDGLRLEIGRIGTGGPRLARYQRGGEWA